MVAVPPSSAVGGSAAGHFLDEPSREMRGIPHERCRRVERGVGGLFPVAVVRLE